jgi:two-component system OmpR family sensor kinase
MSATDQALERLLLAEGIVIVVVLGLVGGFALVVVRVGLLPLDRMGHTAAAIAGGDLSHRVETADQRTEVGRLGLALNRMLDRLEDAFAAREASQERLRRFIADASHELRTPLASIRGYAELFRMGAAREPEDIAKAMRRIEDEAARMGILVEDLLTLARLDEVREANHGAVDLSVLARDAVDDARATDPEREIELHAQPVAVTGDADQLRQVLANLLRNALVHTPAGTPIEVSVDRENGAVRLAVRDHGPGLPTDDADALFERFWRAEGGRERGKDGAGLGLAIVAGIVDGHAGSVKASNAPGGGAAFEVRLPARN